MCIETEKEDIYILRRWIFPSPLRSRSDPNKVVRQFTAVPVWRLEAHRDIRLPETMEILERWQRPVFVPPCKKGTLEAIDIKTAGSVGAKAAILLE